MKAARPCAFGASSAVNSDAFNEALDSLRSRRSARVLASASLRRRVVLAPMKRRPAMPMSDLSRRRGPAGLRAGFVEFDDAEVDVRGRTDSGPRGNVLGADLPITVENLETVPCQIMRVREENRIA